MINIVVVSHSALLARGVEQLARQMMRGDGCKLALAAGVDDEEHPIGTDAVKVMEAIEAVADGDGVSGADGSGQRAAQRGNRARPAGSGLGRQSAAVCGAAGRRHAGGGGGRQLRRFAGAGGGGGAGRAAGQTGAAGRRLAGREKARLCRWRRAKAQPGRCRTRTGCMRARRRDWSRR